MFISLPLSNTLVQYVFVRSVCICILYILYIPFRKSKIFVGDFLVYKTKTKINAYIVRYHGSFVQTKNYVKYISYI